MVAGAPPFIVFSLKALIFYGLKIECREPDAAIPNSSLREKISKCEHDLPSR
jgi:hypothetical protein